MLNYLWGFMLIIGIIYGVLTGNIKDVSVETISSAKEAINLCITMLGVMGLWMGIMEIASKTGLITSFSKLIRPIIKILFPDIPEGHIANEYIASNFIANFLGLGWAATPLGLKAMKELKELNNSSEIASCDMCTFLIINISSLQLIPINIIAYRSQYGSVNPGRIIGVAIIATLVSTLAGVIYAVSRRKMEKR